MHFSASAQRGVGFFGRMLRSEETGRACLQNAPLETPLSPIRRPSHSTFMDGAPTLMMKGPPAVPTPVLGAPPPPSMIHGAPAAPGVGTYIPPAQLQQLQHSLQQLNNGTSHSSHTPFPLPRTDTSENMYAEEDSDGMADD